MSRPVLLDLYCGAGGAARGYQQAGFRVIGVDNRPQPRYAGDEFIEGDALTVLPVLLATRPVVFVHASPTCQRRARVTAWRGRREDHPDTLLPTLAMLAGGGLPYVVENVLEAAGEMRPDLLLCGTQFGLPIRRHRIFEVGNWTPNFLLPACTCRHQPVLPFMHKGERAFADAMGCTWMNKTEARQAIPPAMTRFIGAALLDHLAATVTP